MRARGAEVELATHHGCHPKHLVDLGREARQPLAHDVAHALGQAPFLDRDGADPPTVLLHQQAPLHHVPQHLGDEEGIAIGLLDQPAHEAGVRDPVEIVTGGPLEEGEDAGLVETLQ